MKNIKKYLKSDKNEIIFYHKKGNMALWYFKDSTGYWYESTYDKNGNQKTYKDSNGFWEERTYDKNGNQKTYKDSDGVTRGFEIEEMTMEEVCEELGRTIKIKK